MSTVARRSFIALICTVVTAWLLLPLTRAAADGAVPYVDPAASGRIGLCDQNGKAVTGGGIDDKPFVWRAVSSVPAPPQYQGSAEKATLLAYQPRPNVSADNWSGDTLTAASTYSNKLVPEAAATPVDFTLRDFINEFKPMQDGLIQLRMYFGIPGLDTYSETYPTTDIRVTGQQWAVVSPAKVTCAAGSSESVEVGLVAGANTASPQSGKAGTQTSTGAPSTRGASPSQGSADGSTEPTVDPGAHGSAKTSAALNAPRSSGSAAAAQSTARTSSAPGATSGDRSSAAPGSLKAAHEDRSSRGTGLVLLLAGLGVAGLGALVLLWYRRRLGGPSSGI